MNFLFRSRQNHHGFTLLEILLVLVVLSLVSVAVISSLPPLSHHRSSDAVQTVYQRSQLLQEDAMLSGRTYGIQLNSAKHAIAFLSYEQGRWQPVPKTMMNSHLTLADDITIQYKPGGSVWLNNDRLYTPEQESDASASTLGVKEKIKTPQIVIYPNGMITPFQLSFIDAEGRSSALAVTSNGQLVLGETK